MEPMPTQVEDADFLTRAVRAALWSEPGTGKTLSTILALKQVGRGTVVAPAVALGMWRRELDWHGLFNVPVISWGLIAKIAETLPFQDALVLDEAHYAVRADAKRTEAIYGPSPGVKKRGGLVGRSGMVWPLTGTPMIRFADDLWPTVSSLWPDQLEYLGIANRTAFEGRYCERDGLGKIVGSRNSSLKLLHETLAGKKTPPQVVMRRTLKEVAPHLPPVTVRLLDVELTTGDAARINAALPPNWRERLANAERDLAEGPAMVTARRLMSLLKVPAAIDLIADAPGKVIVIFVHTETGQALRAACKERAVVIEGATPNARRQELVDDFNRESGPRILFGQLHTMGVAINPHRHCSHMIFVERDWSAATLEQAINRVRRLGQTQHQQIDFLDTTHALDIAMRRTANRKLKSMGLLMGDEA